MISDLREGVMPILKSLVLTILFALPLTVSASADEKQLLEEVRSEALERHAREIVKHVRPSGSPGEFAAIDYVVRTLRSEAIPVEVHEFPAYVSDPVRASLRLAEEQVAYRALTQAFSPSTDPGGLMGELVDCGEGSLKDYEEADVEGKIALVDGGARPEEVKAAADAGARGAVFVSSSERIYEMTVSPVWGTPTHKDYTELPSMPSVAVNKDAGADLRHRLSSGPVTVRLTTEVATGWKTLRVTVATIRSAKNPEAFVLVGGHMDAWHHGATDEGSSNAAMVEMARIFYRHRHELERGLKVAWWTGHSNGRYAGSTWFADRFWTGLRDGALAYMNIDVIGQVGAKIYSAACTPDLDRLAKSVMKDVVDVEGQTRRPARNSDQSFYGIGLPLLQFYHSRTEEDGGYWFWHTPEDTFDKIDFDNLTDETRLYVSALYRLMSRPLPPIEPSATVAEIERLLKEKSKTVEDSALPFDEILEKADRLHNLVMSLETKFPELVESVGAQETSRRLVRLIRPILRVLFQESGPYHQDAALPMTLLPGLTSLESLARLEPASDLYRFTRTHIIRELNRVSDHLDQALMEGEMLAGTLTMAMDNEG
jgi:Iap family predicted aminopeptidase